VASVGIQKHSVGVEIPGFDLPSLFSGLCHGSPEVEFVTWISTNMNNLEIIIVAFLRSEPRLLTWQLG
jgi:hypothetical protein